MSKMQDSVKTRRFGRMMGIALFSAALVGTSVFGGIVPAHAADRHVSTKTGQAGASQKRESLPFSVAPVGDAYRSVGYFKFKGSPKKKQSLPVKITNTSKRAIRVDVQTRNALTSVYGNIQYISDVKTPTAKLLDLKRAARPQISGPMTIKLKASESKTVTYTYEGLDHVTTGTVLGGLAFSEHKDRPDFQPIAKGENKKSSKQTTHRVIAYNRLERLIGVQADYSKMTPNVEMSAPTVKSTPSAPLVLIHVANTTPVIVDHVKLTYAVSQVGKNLFSGVSGDFNMAPSSSFGYLVNWNAKTFAPGTYHLKITMTVNGKTTSHAYDFVVPKKTVKTYQHQTFTQPRADAEGGSLWWIIGLSVIAGGLITWLILFFVKKRKEKKDVASQSSTDQNNTPAK